MRGRRSLLEAEVKFGGNQRKEGGKRVEGTEDDIFKWATLGYFEIRNEIE